MPDPLALTLGQKFELERMSRAIDATVDPQALRGLAKQLLQAWHSQKAATQWVMRQQLGSPPRFGTELASEVISRETQASEALAEPVADPFRDIL